MLRNATATLLKRSIFRYVAFVVLNTCSIAWGASDAKRHFDISTTNAAESLRSFSIQAEREIIFPAETVSGISTNPIKGSFTPREAIDRMVANTGLVAVEDAKT